MEKYFIQLIALLEEYDFINSNYKIISKILILIMNIRV